MKYTSVSTNLLVKRSDMCQNHHPAVASCRPTQRLDPNENNKCCWSKHLEMLMSWPSLLGNSFFVIQINISSWSQLQTIMNTNKWHTFCLICSENIIFLVDTLLPRPSDSASGNYGEPSLGTRPARSSSRWSIWKVSGRYRLLNYTKIY